jgi:inorganic pyrophosphatase
MPDRVALLMRGVAETMFETYKKPKEKTAASKSWKGRKAATQNCLEW